ncbi:phosphoglycerate mutase [Mycena floridula]|nr:phosphoglycerate mutase [Mycena floridula]
MTITVTFIRHGESEDNTKSIWAGWKDAPLSELGQKQAEAVGRHLSTTPIDIVYASPLLRAHATGKAVHQGQQKDIPFVVNPHLREQHFGVAEGERWVIETPPGYSYPELFEKKIFPVLDGRDAKFPDGESIAELASRANMAVQECIVPHLTAENFSRGFHIALASHGLCISEVVAALLRLDPTADQTISYKGLLNTAWTRVEITQEGKYTSGSLTVTIRVTHVNQREHLEKLREPVAEISQNEEASQARAFFGGSVL